MTNKNEYQELEDYIINNYVIKKYITPVEYALFEDSIFLCEGFIKYGA